MKVLSTFPSLQLILFFGAFVTAIQFNGGGNYDLFGISLGFLLVALTVQLVRSYNTGIIISLKGPIGWLLLFAFWCVASALWSEVPGTSYTTFPIFIAGAVASIIGVNSTTLHYQHLTILIRITGLVLAVYTMYQAFYLGIHRPAAFMINWNTHAALINLILLPLAADYLHSHRKTWIGLLLLALAFSSSLTLSRGALLGMFFGLAAIFLLSRRAISTKLITQVVAWIGVGYILGSTTLAGGTISRLVSDDITTGRIEIWTSGWDMFMQFPVLGWGIGTFWLAYPAFKHPLDASAGQNVHNEYLQFLIELGPIGLVLFLLLIYALVRIVVATKRQGITSNLASISGHAGALAALAIQSAFTSNYYHLGILLLFGLYVGRLVSDTSDSRLTSVNPSNYFTRLGYPILVVSIALFPAIWLYSFYASERQLETLRGASTAAEVFDIISRAERLYPTRDATHLLFSLQIRHAILETKDMSATQKRELIEMALTKLRDAEHLFPLRAENYYTRALLMKLLPEFYNQNEIISAYRHTLALNPYYLDARISFANYLLSIKDERTANEVLESGWNRVYYAPVWLITTYLDMLKDARQNMGSPVEPMTLELARERIIKQRDQYDLLVATWFVGITPEEHATVIHSGERHDSSRRQD